MRLPPTPTAVAPAATPSPTARESQIVAHIETPLAKIALALEERIQKRLAKGQFAIGPGGTVSYSVERGALSLSVTSTSLVVEMPVTAQAEACRGSRCYASCEPQAVVRASVPLLLRSDYRFEPSAISINFTRGCKVRALGGLLTIDVTPTLESELQSELTKAARLIDRQLPDFRGEVERYWSELAKPQPLPLGGCFLLEPRAVVQGALTPSNTTLRINAAVLATPELRAQCGEAPSPTPLPALTRDLALPEEGAVFLGMVTPLAGFEKSLLAANPVQASQRALKIAGARLAARGSDVDATFTLGGDVCGDATVGATPDFSGDGQFIGLARPTLSSAERERWQTSGVDGQPVVTALLTSARVTPLLSAPAIREVAPTLVQGLSRPRVQVSAKVSSARAAGAAARGDDLVAWLEAHGSVTIQPK